MSWAHLPVQKKERNQAEQIYFVNLEIDLTLGETAVWQARLTMSFSAHDLEFYYSHNRGLTHCARLVLLSVCVLDQA